MMLTSLNVCFRVFLGPVLTAGYERFLGQVNLLAINADGGGGILDSECPTGRAGNLPDGAHTPPEDPTRVN